MVLDVLDERLRLFHLVGLRLHPDALDAADPALVEHGVHGDDTLELTRDLCEIAVLHDSCRASGLERVRGERIPATEDEIVERCERDELLDEWIAVLFALAEADVGHLGDRAEWGDTGLAGGQDAGDEGRGDGTESGRQHTELAGCGGDVLGHGQHHKEASTRI